MLREIWSKYIVIVKLTALGSICLVLDSVGAGTADIGFDVDFFALVALAFRSWYNILRYVR